MKLDRSRPYAETIGPSVARYHQDGRDFDSSDNEIGGEIEAPQDNAQPAKRKPGRPPKVAE